MVLGMDTTTLSVNGICNAGCSFCALSGQAAADLGSAMSRLEDDFATGARHLRIGGGEPMLLPELTDLSLIHI